MDGFESASERRQAICNEVNLYLWAVEDPEFNAKGEPIIPPKPEALYWMRWIERYGFPEPGGWLDQPFGFMYDIEAARAGLLRFRKEQEINEKLRNG